MISGRISEEDYLSAQRLHHSRGRIKRIMFLSVLAVVGLLLFWFSFSPYAAILLGMGAGGLLVESWPGAYDWKRRKLYKQQASLKEQFTYSWDADALRVSSESGAASRKWKDYIRHAENERMFLLYHSDIMFEIFPKSWFSSSEQLGDFRDLASRAGT